MFNRHNNINYEVPLFVMCSGLRYYPPPPLGLHTPFFQCNFPLFSALFNPALPSYVSYTVLSPFLFPPSALRTSHLFPFCLTLPLTSLCLTHYPYFLSVARNIQLSFHLKKNYEPEVLLLLKWWDRSVSKSFLITEFRLPLRTWGFSSLSRLDHGARSPRILSNGSPWVKKPQCVTTLTPISLYTPLWNGA